MVKTVEPQQFSEMEMNYLEYLRRYKKAGEPEGRLRVPLFAKYLQRLAEGDFFLAALVEQRKKGSKAYAAVLKDQAELRARLLIEDTLPELEEAPLIEETEIPIAPLKPAHTRKPKDEDGGDLVAV